MGLFALIFGLILILFPKAMSKAFRIGAGPGVFRTRVENKKVKVGLQPTMSKEFGEEKAIIIMRVIGVIFIISSIFAFIYAPF